jgi:hypothetical protein
LYSTGCASCTIPSKCGIFAHRIAPGGVRIHVRPDICSNARTSARSVIVNKRFTHNMAPSTRNTIRASTPERPIRSKEFDTIKKTRFFRNYDQEHSSKTLGAISTANGITDRTARRWLAQRRDIGSPAYRHMRKRSTVLRRKSRVLKETCQMLVLLFRNPVRNQLYKA